MEVNMGSPTTLKCDPQSIGGPPPAQKNAYYGLSHIIQYLDQVEECIQSSTDPTPALRYNHCHNSDDKKTFFKSVGSVLAKPMLRTLIYGGVDVDGDGRAKSRKILFDQRIREARVWIEGQRVYSFMIDYLKPAVDALDVDTRREKVPDLLDKIDAIKDAVERKETGGDNTPSPMVRATGTSALFSRLASGRRYQGRLERLINDLFPEISNNYHEASTKVTDREILEYIINNDLVIEKKEHQKDESDEEKGLAEKRIRAAFKCLDKFYPGEAGHLLSLTEKKNESGAGVESGKKCEESCVNFLQNEYIQYSNGEQILDAQQNYTRRRRKVLRNVYINGRRNGDNSGTRKYMPPKMYRKGAVRKEEMDGTGIIWTDCDSARHRLTSEFDAIILSSEAVNSTYIESIWEAKKTISPSTIHDILTKKLGAIKALTEDKGAELVYCDGESTETIPFSSQKGGFTFGVYGFELQRPENAADSIRSIAGSNVVSYNIQEVIRSLDRDVVMVEVELDSALNIVQSLKAVIEKIQDQDLKIELFVEQDVDFL